MTTANGGRTHAPHTAPVVHIVEDDDDVRTATARLLTAAGYAVRTHPTASEFLAQRTHTSDCAVLDLELPGMSGLELQELLAATVDDLPVVFVTGKGDISSSVRAMKAGAVDFLTKPVQKAALLEAIGKAVTRHADARAIRTRVRDAEARYDRLTPREREVFAHLISGKLNKQMAWDLGAAERTIKAHRHSIMEKLEAVSIADLIALASDLRIPPAPRDK